jgi:hypothetical protein
MGITRTDFIIYGFKVNPEEISKRKIDLWSDLFRHYREGNKDIPYVIVYDGMNEDYLVFGKIIQSTNDYDGIPLTKISYKDFFNDDENDSLTDAFIDLFGEEIYDTLEEEDPEIIIFSHFS